MASEVAFLVGNWGGEGRGSKILEGTSGVVMNYCVLPSFLYLLLLLQRRLGWRMFGTYQMKGVIGPLASLGS